MKQKKLQNKVSETEFLEVWEKISKKLGYKFKFGYHSHEDMKQQAAIFALEGLKNYDKSSLYYIGNELDHIKQEFCLYMSGGGGYAISNGLYKILHKYVIETGINNSYKHWCDDLCIGLWINEMKEKSSDSLNVFRSHDL